MPDIKSVVGAFFPLGKTAEAAFSAQRGKLFFAACDDLMRIGLMADIPDQLVVRRVENIMKRQSQLHGAQRRGQMPAVGGDCVNDQLANFLSQSIHFSDAEFAEVNRIVDLLQHAVIDGFHLFHWSL